MDTKMQSRILAARRTIRRQRPLIHCITNPISIHQCANTILAAGARPIMAEHPREVAEITRTAKALVLNLGNITDIRMESMRIALDTAAASGIPVILDLVGIACSELRRDFALSLLDAHPCTVLKGNYSEVQALYEQTYRASGVDAAEDLTPDKIRLAAMALARQYRTSLLSTGAVDIIADGDTIWQVQNGTPQLGTVTGTGCMLTALAGCFLTATDTAAAILTASALLGVSGELAATELGPGTFMVNLMDQLQTLPDETLITRSKITPYEGGTHAI